MRPGVRQQGCLQAWETYIILAGLVVMIAAIPVLHLLS